MHDASEVPEVAVTDEELTRLLGPKCPDCGWRQGQHRPGGEWLGEPCPRAGTQPAPTPATSTTSAAGT